jgi:hypothetical protein
MFCRKVDNIGGRERQQSTYSRGMSKEAAEREQQGTAGNSREQQGTAENSREQQMGSRWAAEYSTCIKIIIYFR